MAKIYVGPPAGGSGGGGSVNPTSGTVPVNLFGSFVDSLIQSGASVGNGTILVINDATEFIEARTGTSFVNIDGAADVVNIEGTNGIQIHGGVFINNHLGIDILRFLSNGASHAAIKVVGNRLIVRNGNDTANNDFAADNIQASGAVTSLQDFITNGKSILSSLVNSNFTLYNNGKTAFNLLQFGGVGNTFPALKRAATELQVRLADDSGTANIRAGVFIVDAATGGVQFTTTMNLYVGTSASNSVLFGNLGGVSIGKGAALPVASAQFEVVSTTRGVLFPRMTAAQRTAITAPAVGLMVYQIDGGAAEGIWINKSTGWVQGV